MTLIKTKDLYNCDITYLKKLFENCEYPWQILPKIKEMINELILCGIEDFEQIQKGVLTGRNVIIHPTATIEAPAVIGHGTVVRPGAYLRGNVITGSNCVLGNSSEFKNCILLDNVKAPHYNYVGDSVLGNNSHIGAGTICSNLKTSGTEVVVRADKEYKTGLKKVGSFLADGVDVASACVLNPGTVIGKNSWVYPMNCLRGVFPKDSIVKNSDNVLHKENS